MIKRKIAIAVLLLCLCIRLMPFGAQAITIADAVEPIIPQKECSLTISYCYGDIAFSDVQVKLYKIADVSSACAYTLTQPFVRSGLILNGIQSAGEWNVIRSTLEAYILAYDVDYDAVSVTDSNGQVRFDALGTGMYLATVSHITHGDQLYSFSSALVAVPGLEDDGRWKYDVSVNAKGEALPPIEPDEKIEFKVLKLWKGEANKNDRPKSVEIEIFRNGISCETVILSEENNWSYTWLSSDDGSSWSVVERNVPEGYTMTVDVRDTCFTITNTYNSTDPDDPIPPPPTGDTSNVMLYVLIMMVSGIILIMLGLTRKRTR